ncbi:hypothetical protein OVY01_22735 [Robbsia sp. Bb-Pol-6]|uniref:Ankyrin n=1 Tax=Robbsia betulipollinis TaxID=2981849 RepID=A0ABT3ZVT4_9BURK|nr:hypothetical protein [Robbsia betulipollinis]MCY0389958.1 hypothetical protein [Robbsia betulipollinis]
MLRKRIKTTSDPHLTLAANLLFDGSKPVMEGYEKDGLLSLLVKLDYVDDVVRNLAEADPWAVSQYLLDARTPAMVDALIGLGADVRFDNCGCTFPSLGLPAFYAAAHGYFDVEQRLLEHGADPSSFDGDPTGDGVPLEYAANRNDIATCMALLNRGADAERVKRSAHVWTNSNNEAWSLIKSWEHHVLAKAASDSGVVEGREVRVRVRL